MSQHTGVDVCFRVSVQLATSEDLRPNTFSLGAILVPNRGLTSSHCAMSSDDVRRFSTVVLTGSPWDPMDHSNLQSRHDSQGSWLLALELPPSKQLSYLYSYICGIPL